jgi:hypothetical protein
MAKDVSGQWRAIQSNDTVANFTLERANNDGLFWEPEITAAPLLAMAMEKSPIHSFYLQ